MTVINSQRGSTLFEMLLYMALFSFIISATLLSVYQLLSSSDANASKNDAEGEANFIIAKINWALTDITSITEPAPNDEDDVLLVTKSGPTTIRFSLSGTNIVIEEDGASGEILNSERVQVSSLSFEHVRQLGTATVDSITASFYVNDKYFETEKTIR